MSTAEYGHGRKVSCNQAMKIADKIWSRQGDIAGNGHTEEEGALTRVIKEETGRLIRSERNLAKIRSVLYDM